jgi:hypothetical protein
MCLAWLGLKAMALAWPERALALENLRPGPNRRPWLGFGLAWLRPGLLAGKSQNVVVCTQDPNKKILILRDHCKILLGLLKQRKPSNLSSLQAMAPSTLDDHLKFWSGDVGIRRFFQKLP